MMSGERGGQSFGPSRPIQWPGNNAFRTRRTSSNQWVELRVVEKRHLVAGVPAEKVVELQHVQVLATFDSLLRKEKLSDDHVAHDATPNVYFRIVSHMFHGAVLLL
jgi:hypothetical protein